MGFMDNGKLTPIAGDASVFLEISEVIRMNETEIKRDD